MYTLYLWALRKSHMRRGRCWLIDIGCDMCDSNIYIKIGIVLDIIMLTACFYFREAP